MPVTWNQSFWVYRDYVKDLKFNPEWSPYVGPGLSTIAQPTDDLGRIAAGCLIERLKGLELPPRQILLSGRLVARGSSQTAVI